MDIDNNTWCNNIDENINIELADSDPAKSKKKNWKKVF